MSIAVRVAENKNTFYLVSNRSFGLEGHFTRSLARYLACSSG